MNPHEGSDPLVYAMREIFDGVPITRVVHDADGDWQYLTDSEPAPSAALLVHQSHVLAFDPSLGETVGLAVGRWAGRWSPEDPWIFGDLDGS